MRRWLAVVAALLLAIAGARAQTVCATCGGTGLLPCRVCADVEHAGAECTVAAGCGRCQGALATLCSGCANGTAELQRRKAMAQQYLKGHRALLEEHRIDGRGVMQCRTAHFELLFATGGIDGCPQSDPHLQMHLFALRLEQVQARFAASFGAPAVTERCRIAVLKDEGSARALCAGLTGLEMQGIGGTSRGPQFVAVLQQTGAAGKDAALHRLLAHHVAHLLLAQALAGIDLDQLGYGWLDEGLAHWFEADQAGGVCENFCIQGRPQPSRRFQGGDWRKGARELLAVGQLPALAPLLACESSDLDFAQHVAAFALVDFLLVQLPPPQTGGGAPPPAVMPQLLAAVGNGKRAEVALPAVLGKDLAAIDAALREFVQQKYPRR